MIRYLLLTIGWHRTQIIPSVAIVCLNLNSIGEQPSDWNASISCTRWDINYPQLTYFHSVKATIKLASIETNCQCNVMFVWKFCKSLLHIIIFALFHQSSMHNMYFRLSSEFCDTTDAVYCSIVISQNLIGLGRPMPHELKCVLLRFLLITYMPNV